MQCNFTYSNPFPWKPLMEQISSSSKLSPHLVFTFKTTLRFFKGFPNPQNKLMGYTVTKHKTKPKIKPLTLSFRWYLRVSSNLPQSTPDFHLYAPEVVPFLQTYPSGSWTPRSQDRFTLPQILLTPWLKVLEQELN